MLVVLHSGSLTPLPRDINQSVVDTPLTFSSISLERSNTFHLCGET